MDGWTYYEGKNVFIILKSKRRYSGKVIEIDHSSPPLVFLTIIDKFGKYVRFVHSEIELIEEELDNGVNKQI